VDVPASRVPPPVLPALAYLADEGTDPFDEPSSGRHRRPERWAMSPGVTGRWPAADGSCPYAHPPGTGRVERRDGTAGARPGSAVHLAEW